MTNTAATALHTLISQMADARRQYAADHGFEANDDEIAASIKASLLRMMAEG